MCSKDRPQKPKVPPGTPNMTRSDLCAIQEQVITGQRDLRDALQGLQLKFAHWNVSSYFNVDGDGYIREDDPGLVARIADELARRAKFSWRESWGLYKVPGDYNMSFTEIAADLTSTHDCLGWWFMKTSERMALGIAFPRGYIDASMLLTTMLETDGQSWDLLAVFSPFDFVLWICIVAMMILSSLIYWSHSPLAPFLRCGSSPCGL